MLIDWFTVAAQVLNFAVLVWLMKRFLYQPILHAIDTREAHIAAALADADQKQAAAGRERDAFQQKTGELERQRAALMRQAKADAEAERKRLLEEARQAANALSARREEALREEARRLNDAVLRRTQQEVFAIARKVLGDLASTRLEARAADTFVQRLREIDAPTRERIGSALRGANARALVRSAFELPAEQRAAIRQAVEATFSAGIPLDFETAPELVSGIELSASGQKLAWSIAGYLGSMQQAVQELLEPRTAPAAGDR